MKILKKISEIISNLSIDSIYKRIILNVLLIILFIYFQKGINTFIENYLAYEGLFSNGWITFLILIITSMSLVGLYKKILLDNYLYTLNYINTISVIFFFLFTGTKTIFPIYYNIKKVEKVNKIRS